MARPKKNLPITSNSTILPSPSIPVKVVYDPHNCSPALVGTSYAANEYTSESLASYYPYSRSLDGTLPSSELAYLKYNNLINRSEPFNEQNGFWNIRNCVILCQTAYREVPVFNQTIETMTVLANTPMVWRGGSDNCKKFLKVWWEKIGGFNTNEQAIRELTRSSNLFVYRYDGGIKSNKINKFILGDKIKDKSEAAKTINIPVKYEILNPADICAIDDWSINHTPSYYRFFDISTKNRLNKLQQNKNVEIKLDDELLNILKQDYSLQLLAPEKLTSIFYHKQDYEPFATPMGYPVLEDINLKLEFKKCDAVVSKTVESIIMLVTHGAEPDKGGMNPIVDSALKQVFQTKQTGRILISDYTTKIDFIIPDLKKVIGPEKYQKLDQDINDGLMNIFFGDQKFANIMVKLRVFVAILTYIQEILINELWQKEIKRVCRLVGYKEEEIPVARFRKIQLEDPSQTHRIWAQLAQLGLLTAEETFEAVETGLLPTGPDSEKSQEKYKKLREKDYYFPLVGGSDKGEEVAGGRPKGTGTPKKISKPGFKGGSSGSYNFDIQKFKENILLANNITNELTKLYLKKAGRKKVTEDDKKQIETIASHLIINEQPSEWENKVTNYTTSLSEPNIINIGKVEEIKEENSVSDFTAGLLLHSIVE